uniref:Uncharacterized protein n=1 Tax=Rhizophora mucronata TaxID=61149 RepID=A0A2P2Q430_RHIMU
MEENQLDISRLANLANPSDLPICHVVTNQDHIYNLLILSVIGHATNIVCHVKLAQANFFVNHMSVMLCSVRPLTLSQIKTQRACHLRRVQNQIHCRGTSNAGTFH